MAGYILHYYNIIDRSRIDELGPLSLPNVEKYGGVVMVGSPVKTLEGKSAYSSMVIYKFDSFEAALECYNSPVSAEFAEVRSQSIDGISMVLPGHEETQSVIDSGYFRN